MDYAIFLNCFIEFIVSLENTINKRFASIGVFGTIWLTGDVFENVSGKNQKLFLECFLLSDFRLSNTVSTVLGVTSDYFLVLWDRVSSIIVKKIYDCFSIFACYLKQSFLGNMVPLSLFKKVLVWQETFSIFYGPEFVFFGTKTFSERRRFDFFKIRNFWCFELGKKRLSSLPGNPSG